MDNFKSKREIVEAIMRFSHGASVLYELLRGNSKCSARVEPTELPMELLKLMTCVNGHLRFIAKFGEGQPRVLNENGTYFVSYPDKFEEWLHLDVPLISMEELECCYTQLKLES